MKKQFYLNGVKVFAIRLLIRECYFNMQIGTFRIKQSIKFRLNAKILFSLMYEYEL